MFLNAPRVPAPYSDAIDTIVIFGDGYIGVTTKDGEDYQQYTREGLELAYPGLWKRMTQ